MNNLTASIDSASDAAGSLPQIVTTEAVLLFIDLAGFSKMSAELVVHDSRGAEEMMRIVNRGVNSFIEIIAENGGFVAATAGDALVAFWQSSDEIDAAVEHAKRAAQAIQAMPDITYAGNKSVQAKVLLDCGTVQLLTLGGADGKFVRVFAGDMFAQLTRNAAAMEPEHIATTPAFDNAQGGATHPLLTRAAFQDGLGYINHVEGPPVFPTEFRAIAAMFIRLPVAHLTDPAAAQSVAMCVQQAVAAQNGSLLHYQCDDKGLVGIAAWGVPNTAHEAKSAHAIFAGNTIVAALGDLGVSVQIGISTGDALVGEIGNDHFRQYTVLSDIVNRAAALATHADEGQILCDQPVSQTAQQRFRFVEAKHFLLKGYEGEIIGYQPVDESSSQVDFSTEIIGRDEQIDIIRSVFMQATPQHGPILRVVAGAGLGKSHLGTVLEQMLERHGFKCLRGAGDALRTASALRAWQPIFATLMRGIERNRIIDILGENRVYLPLLSQFLNATEDETEASKALQPEARGQLINDMILTLLRALTKGTPTVLVFEDTHWLDSASWGLIAQCRRQMPDLGLLLLTRPVRNEDQSMAALSLFQNENIVSVDLHPLNRAGSDLLVAAQLGANDIPPRLAAQIYQLAGGHPLYTKELTKAILDRGIVRVSNGHCHMSTQQLGFEHEGFPKNLSATLAERIDTLGASAQQFLKLAAVQGRNVDLEILTRLWTDRSASFTDALAEVAGHGLLEQISVGKWQFHHVLISEVAYNLLLKDEQKDLHRRTANAMEAGSGGTDQVSLLAYHWQAGDRPLKALPYLDQAVGSARAQHAHDDVLRYGKQALAIADNHHSAATQDQVGFWHNAMQAAYRSQGHFIGTDYHLHAIIGLFDQPVPKKQAMVGLRAMAEFIRLKTGRKIAGKSRDAQLLAASAYLTSAEVAYDRQDTLNVLHGTLRGANLAFSAGGNAVEVAIANAQMAMTAVFIRFALDGDKFSARAEAMLDSIDDESARAWIYLVLSTYQFSSGRFEKACELSDHAMASAVLSREAKIWEYAVAGKSNVLRMQAKFEQCDALDHSVYNSGHDRGVPQVKLWGGLGRVKNLWITNQFDLFEQWLERNSSLLSNDLNKLNSAASNTISHHIFLALKYLRDGHPSAAVTELLETKRLFDGLRDPQIYMVDTLSYIMDAVRGLHHAGGHKADVLKLTDFLVKAAKNTNRLYPMCWARLHLAKGDWHEVRGDINRAAKEWTKATATTGPVDIAFDNAMAHYRLANFANLGPEDRAAHHAATMHILGRLDVALPVSWTL